MIPDHANPIRLPPPIGPPAPLSTKVADGARRVFGMKICLECGRETPFLIYGGDAGDACYPCMYERELAPPAGSR